MKTLVAAFVLALGFATVELRAQNEPNLIPDVVDPAKLIPILPEAPTGWTAEKAEGSSDDLGGFKITNVHRDYRKARRRRATAAISILDSVANPDYVEATSGAWKQSSETPEGYGKSVTIDEIRAARITTRNENKPRSGSWSPSATSSRSNCKIRTRKNCRSGSSAST